MDVYKAFQRWINGLSTSHMNVTTDKIVQSSWEEKEEDPNEHSQPNPELQTAQEHSSSQVATALSCGYQKAMRGSARKGNISPLSPW